MLSDVMLGVFILSVLWQTVQSVLNLSIVLLSVIMESVIVPSVVAPPIGP